MKKAKTSKAKKISVEEYANLAAFYLRNEIYHGEYNAEIVISKTPKEDSPDCAAEIRIDEVYLNFTITVYPKGKAAFERSQREFFLLMAHEICHLLTEPLYLWACSDNRPSEKDRVEEVRERQTQRICNALVNFMPKDIHLPEVLKKLQ